MQPQHRWPPASEAVPSPPHRNDAESRWCRVLLYSVKQIVASSFKIHHKAKRCIILKVYPRPPQKREQKWMSYALFAMPWNCHGGVIIFLLSNTLLNIKFISGFCYNLFTVLINYKLNRLFTWNSDFFIRLCLSDSEVIGYSLSCQGNNN